ncbi:hypothetical protein PC41400_25425 [Paenibacillus chitinolyticus]|uniref:Uncharacterized protein n=1 Tax=Paenibacillus chitinolyticus TaxID=79263 RepID=A0A410X2K8_9BACL|nr:hypothetical protein PC41400_25425 [Paenibacillus chitinolyticus]
MRRFLFFVRLMRRKSAVIALPPVYGTCRSQPVMPFAPRGSIRVFAAMFRMTVSAVCGLPYPRVRAACCRQGGHCPRLQTKPPTL